MKYFTSILKGINNRENKLVSFTYTYQTNDTISGNTDAYIYLKKVANKECKGNFTEQSIEHNEITLSKYNEIINGIFEMEIVDDDLTNDEENNELGE